MTTRTQNNVLVGAHTIFAAAPALCMLGVMLFFIIDNKKPLSKVRPEQWLAMAVLSLIIGFCLIQLITAYGLWKRKAWARHSALVLSTMVIWYFPMGTALWIYTRWFLKSEEGRQLYSKAKRREALI